MLKIKQQIHAIIRDYTEASEAEYGQAKSFAELNIDSLSMVEIIFDIEEAFDIKIPDETELDKRGLAINNFNDVLTVVTQLVEKK